MGVEKRPSEMGLNAGATRAWKAVPSIGRDSGGCWDWGDVASALGLVE